MALLQFTLIPTSLPPMLLQMMGVSLDIQYFGLTYQGSKATWSDGRSTATFSYYGVYEPLINHMAIACYLWDYHLGSDDEYPTHALLLDRTDSKMYVGEVKAVEKFLDSQHPPRQPITRERYEQLLQELDNDHPALSMDELKKLGMFEMFGSISLKQQQQKKELVQWLDQQVTKKLLKQYIAEAKTGNYNAMFALEQLKTRIDKATGKN